MYGRRQTFERGSLRRQTARMKSWSLLGRSHQPIFSGGGGGGGGGRLLEPELLRELPAPEGGGSMPLTVKRRQLGDIERSNPTLKRYYFGSGEEHRQ